MSKRRGHDKKFKIAVQVGIRRAEPDAGGDTYLACVYTTKVKKRNEEIDCISDRDPRRAVAAALRSVAGKIEKKTGPLGGLGGSRRQEQIQRWTRALAQSTPYRRNRGEIWDQKAKRWVSVYDQLTNEELITLMIDRGQLI